MIMATECPRLFRDSDLLCRFAFRPDDRSGDEIIPFDSTRFAIEISSLIVAPKRLSLQRARSETQTRRASELGEVRDRMALFSFLSLSFSFFFFFLLTRAIFK